MPAPSDTSGSPASDSTRDQPPDGSAQPITFYHWLVVFLAASGWLFDCMGQRIFVLSREPALKELLGVAASDGALARWGGNATLCMMVGWATGGILFGLMSDRYGRVKAMVTTLLAYTLFSGLSGFAQTATQFLVFRFLFGLGVGGMFGSATTLVAESVPRRLRTLALGGMQALSACGNMLASGLSLWIIPRQENFWGHFSGWQALSFVSVFPAVFAIPMAFFLKEPEAWKRAKAAAAATPTGKQVGSIADLFREPRWRRSTLVGICLGVAGMVGLWGIAFFSPELIASALRERPLQSAEILQPAQLCLALKTPGNLAAAHIREQLPGETRRALDSVPADAIVVSPAKEQFLASELNRLIETGNLYDPVAFRSLELKKATRNLIQQVARNGNRASIRKLNRQLLEQTFPGRIRELQGAIDHAISRGTLLQDVGSLLGMFAFTFVAAYAGRRFAFLAFFLLCLVSVASVFYFLKTESDIAWMLPLVGFSTLSVFAGYSIYFPEIFPTRLRGTGVGFCYNTVRYLAAPFPSLRGFLSAHMSFRTVAVLMSSIYLVGLLALLWAPETKGRPLPED